jgi:hypothetical protein
MADYKDLKATLAQLKEDEKLARFLQLQKDEDQLTSNSMGPTLTRGAVERQSFDIQPKDTGTVLDRLNLQGCGSKSQDLTALGGRLGYTQPIDEDSSIQAGLSGHYVKGKGFKDKAIDRADVRYQKKFKNDSELRASIGANVNKNMGKRGINEANIEYEIPFKKGGKVKVSKASKRADGCAQRGKTRGRLV